MLSGDGPKPGGRVDVVEPEVAEAHARHAAVDAETRLGAVAGRRVGYAGVGLARRWPVAQGGRLMPLEARAARVLARLKLQCVKVVEVPGKGHGGNFFTIYIYIYRIYILKVGDELSLNIYGTSFDPETLISDQSVIAA